MDCASVLDADGTDRSQMYPAAQGKRWNGRDAKLPGTEPAHCTAACQSHGCQPSPTMILNDTNRRLLEYAMCATQY